MMKPFFKFNRECQNEALKRYGKRFADLTDKQCAEVTKAVSKRLKKEEKNG